MNGAVCPCPGDDTQGGQGGPLWAFVHSMNPKHWLITSFFTVDTTPQSQKYSTFYSY
jgi:hypothetical protein